MAASLLTEETLRLTNMPRLADTRFLGKLLQRLGTEVVESNGEDGPETLLRTTEITSGFAPYDLVRQMRASFNVLGPLLARTGQAKVSLPGGCTIGARPVDLHLKALEALGARIDLHEGYVYAQAPRGLKGGQIDFPFNSVGATEHAMLAAVLADGETTITNAACEPELVDLESCLNAMGAKVSGAGTSTIRIQGASRLHGATYAVMPDRIETGTYALAAAMAGGEVRLTRTRSDFIQAMIDKMVEAAWVEVTPHNDGLTVRRNGALLKAVEFETDVYPGFPTDLQAPFMALMTLAEGESVIRENIFENRLMHAPGTAGAWAPTSTVQGGEARVCGVASLEGAQVMATDLRALGQPGDRAAWRRAARLWSTASTTSTAASSALEEKLWRPAATRSVRIKCDGVGDED